MHSYTKGFDFSENWFGMLLPFWVRSSETKRYLQLSEGRYTRILNETRAELLLRVFHLCAGRYLHDRAFLVRIPLAYSFGLRNSFWIESESHLDHC
jgi:hypothetical protein